MELNQWVKAARAHAKLTQETLGERVGRTKANVGHWEKGLHRPSWDMIQAIAAATGYPMPSDNVGDKLDTKPMAQLPLVGEVKGGPDGYLEELQYPVGHGEGVVEHPTSDPNAYALRVRGDSMTAPSGNSRTYPEGCVIFVDPEKRSPVNGDRVIAKLKGTSEVTFKVYKNEDGRQWLQPLNPSHEPIREEFKILGKVLGKWEDG